MCSFIVKAKPLSCQNAWPRISYSPNLRCPTAFTFLTDFAVCMFVVSHVIGWHDWRKMILAVPQASGSLFSTSWSMYSLWRRLVRISSRLFQGRLTGIPESVLLASIVSHDISKKKGPMYAMGEGWRDKLISLPGGVLACQTMSWLLWPELGGTGSFFSPALAGTSKGWKTKAISLVLSFRLANVPGLRKPRSGLSVWALNQYDKKHHFLITSFWVQPAQALLKNIG